ncbi:MULTISPECIES: TetR/AcrR family transcriptional regulator [unclassified Mesorhizobium]|uniref:TetR/AcrR family transcriptional regulator n=1 Tax=unclassified Mesorhizobium TaxID=325217 RepID=UPI000BB0BE91|nr:MULTISPECIES: TetR/AcrR family transcriptional regulator [unclassified Mesorhizobium]TGT56756.1 TetR/AcrR family transcriptional regulator [Mesorhizobium sp. M00.F.Ca.ET.170.01.1.1]AZO08523.1 TetR/AcrR family transcriptional regulator [Mesorhizobium sp. M3A.F.Ca.ET.080.04.2.1]PBB85589.1 TetR family transcriptional regulator [Mesorhizobium sp. WSM3876]RWB71641.1 MAG: TetR/AcrR family transcriptional regulator [Mesorhizobium sp.]RWB85106.1 MAG: TetR/AcrR family transcriptional regulator [Meso
MREARRTATEPRRKPKQERSRERIDAILATTMRLIGEKGIDAVTMKEVGALAGGPIATVYHYFPSKSAILAMLYDRFAEESRARFATIIAEIRGLDDVTTAADRLLDDYCSRVAADPAIQDLQNAIQADKALQHLDIAETRRQADMFCTKVAPMLRADQREAFGRVVFLIFQLAGGVVRLALTQDEAEGRRTIEDYRSIIHAQLRLFL